MKHGVYWLEYLYFVNKTCLQGKFGKTEKGPRGVTTVFPIAFAGLSGKVVSHFLSKRTAAQASFLRCQCIFRINILESCNFPACFFFWKDVYPFYTGLENQSRFADDVKRQNKEKRGEGERQTSIFQDANKKPTLPQALDSHAAHYIFWRFYNPSTVPFS